MRIPPARRLLPLALGAVALLIGVSAPAGALPPNQIGVYPTWTAGGASGAFTATATFTPSANFPPVNVTSNSTTVRAPTGDTAWLGDSTAFGQEFGASRSQPYLYLSTAAGFANSTTTLTFSGAPPSGWGFALGDVDADWVFIQAYQDAARTIPLTPAQLGFQSAGNYCNNTPKPSSCATGPFTDAPVWVTAPETFDGVNYVPGTLRGNSLAGAPAPTLDTAGAYGWFKPTVPVLSMDLLYGRRAGAPIFQLWLATPAPKAVISGTVTLPDQPPGTPIPAGTTANLQNADGTPVLNIEDQPLTAPVAPDGTYVIETEQRDGYLIQIDPPDGYVAPPAVPVAALAAEVTVPPITVSAEPPVTTTTTPTASTVPSVPDPGSLPPTGVDVPVVLLVGAIVLGLGLVLGRLRRRVPS